MPSVRVSPSTSNGWLSASTFRCPSQASFLVPTLHLPDIGQVSTNSNISNPRAPKEFQAAKGHFEQLQVAMSTIASQHAGATAQQKNAWKYMYGLVTVAIISCSLFNPAIAASAATWLPRMNVQGVGVLLPVSVRLRRDEQASDIK